jgi:hypothetical protein
MAICENFVPKTSGKYKHINRETEALFHKNNFDRITIGHP